MPDQTVPTAMRAADGVTLGMPFVYVRSYLTADQFVASLEPEAEPVRTYVIVATGTVRRIYTVRNAYTRETWAELDVELLAEPRTVEPCSCPECAEAAERGHRNRPFCHSCAHPGKCPGVPVSGPDGWRAP